MEAGNRCFDERVPEEINRRIVDHISDINLPIPNTRAATCCPKGYARNRHQDGFAHAGSPWLL
jgi:UDP-N-acetylglucosamine 2-epimerase (non-hydrolysing)